MHTVLRQMLYTRRNIGTQHAFVGLSARFKRELETPIMTSTLGGEKTGEVKERTGEYRGGGPTVSVLLCLRTGLI